MDGGIRDLTQIITPNRNLQIPFYQRTYVWGEPELERFLNDMVNVSKNDKPYFLGTIILKQKSTSSDSTNDIRIVIDGQQRLTTLNIFFKVLCLKNDSNNKFERVFFNLNGGSILQHNYINSDSFNKVINSETLIEFNHNEIKKDKIFLAYKYFNDNISSIDLDYMKIIKHIKFIGLDLDESDNEQEIFDSMNSIGVGLTAAELLKNYLFDNSEIELYEIYWKNIFETEYWDFKIGNKTLIDIFLFSFLQIKIQDTEFKVSSNDKLSFLKHSDLFKSYKKFIKDYKIDKIKLLTEIKEYSDLFKNNFNIEICKNSISSNIERINLIIFYFNVTPIISYILYILKNVKDEKERNDILSIIESYIMRRIIIKTRNSNYTNLFGESLINQAIITRQDIVKFFLSKDKTDDYFPNNNKICSKYYDEYHVDFNNKISLGVYYMMETKIHINTKHTTIMDCINNYTLEHILPKKYNKWFKSVKLSEKKKDKIENNLCTLGNMTILKKINKFI